jgi:hypothetical protein
MTWDSIGDGRGEEEGVKERSVCEGRREGGREGGRERERGRVGGRNTIDRWEEEVVGSSLSSSPGPWFPGMFNLHTSLYSTALWLRTMSLIFLAH